jgi:SAM-dependent methyltransferase
MTTESFASAYAQFYNLFYKDKDYAAEAAYVLRLLSRDAVAPANILELGCGTGGHAVPLARSGARVHGIDRSAAMVSRAAEQALPADLRARLTFSQGDLRDVRLDGRFDAAISLFHVFSYQTSDEDLHAAFATAATHVKPGGTFLFDFWFGPGVLSDPPVVRVKKVENDEAHVTRIAQPTLRPDIDVVEVHYDLFRRTRATGVISHFEETHRMRYMFLPSLRAMLARHGFERVEFYGWLTDDPPTTLPWYVVAVARREPQ